MKDPKPLRATSPKNASQNVQKWIHAKAFGLFQNTAINHGGFLNVLAGKKLLEEFVLWFYILQVVKFFDAEICLTN